MSRKPLAESDEDLPETGWRLLLSLSNRMVSLEGKQDTLARDFKIGIGIVAALVATQHPAVAKFLSTLATAMQQHVGIVLGP